MLYMKDAIFVHESAPKNKSFCRATAAIYRLCRIDLLRDTEAASCTDQRRDNVEQLSLLSTREMGVFANLAAGGDDECVCVRERERITGYTKQKTVLKIKWGLRQTAHV